MLQSGGQLVLPAAPDPEPILEAMAQTSAQALHASARQLADLLAYFEDRGRLPDNAHLNRAQCWGKAPEAALRQRIVRFLGTPLHCAPLGGLAAGTENFQETGWLGR